MTFLYTWFSLAILTAVAAGNATDAEPALAAEMLTSAPNRAGLCVHLGVTDGSLTAALSNGGRFLVHGLAVDRASVDRARAAIRKAGLYGPVSIEHASLKRLPYAENLVNLVVVDDLPTATANGLELREVFRVLAPTGAAWVGARTGLTADALKARLAAAGIEAFTIRQDVGTWAIVRKPLPPGVDEWTHQNHGPGGNRVSRDVVAGPPRRLRWIAGVPWRMPDYRAKSMVVGGGRVYYVINESSIRKTSWPYLSVRNAFSGVLLWKRAGQPRDLTMIAAGERLYMSSGDKFIAVDGATGRLLKTYDEVDRPVWALLQDDNLLVACGRGFELKCLDPETGKVRWSSTKRSIDPGGGLPNAAILDGRIVYAERRRGTIGCLDLATGTERWHREITEDIDGAKGGRLCAVRPGTMVLYNEKGAQAFSTEDGSHLWNRTHELLGSPTRRKAKSYRDGFFIDNLYWTHVGDIDPKVPAKYRYGRGRQFSWQGLDPATGKVKRVLSYPDGVQVGASCFPDQATTRYFMGGYSTFMEVKTGKHHPRAEGLHTSCGIGLRAAYGLIYNSALYMPGRFLQGDMAVESGEHEPAGAPGDASRLEKGPAYGTAIQDPNPDVPNGASWPIYRHDDLRTSRTSAKVPAGINELWAVEVGAGPSGPTIAAGQVFVASAEEHQVMAIDATTGEEKWRFTAGGPVKVPPTWHRGLCLFGSGDGYVYCLDASSGRLAWRFRAARTPRRIVARGRVESTWPVEEGVIVRDGQACFIAGRHGQVDGGCDLYVVDVVTGKLSWHKPSREGHYPTLLATDGETLALTARDRWALKDGNRAARLALPAAAYSRQHIDPSHVIGKNATVAVKLRALIRAGDVVFAAGRPDPERAEVPRILWRQSRGGGAVENAPDVHPLDSSRPGADNHRLWGFSATDGKMLRELKLPAPPVWDGMAAANSRLYLSTHDGKLRCFGDASIP